MKVTRYRYDDLLFLAIFFLMIYPLIVNPWLVTGDGPCHMYNAKVFFNILFDIDSRFYLDYYKLNLTLAPNLFDHIILGFLQMIFSPSFSEKLFFFLYFFMFCFGGRYLISKINSDNKWISILIMMFAYHHLLMKGFFNFSFSIAFSFWVIGYFISISKGTSIKTKQVLAFSLLLSIAYFIHPIGFIFTFIGIISFFFLSILSSAMKENSYEIAKSKFFESKWLILAFIPVCALYFIYFSNNDFSKPMNWYGLYEMDSIMVFVEEERNLARIIGKSVIIVSAIGFIYRLLRGPLINHKSDGMLITGIVFSLFFLLNLINEGMMGNDRLQFLPHIAFVFWLAGFTYHKYLKIALITVSTTAILFLSSYRYPSFKDASDWVSDYMECKDFISDHSKLLTLNYDYNGTTKEGKTISTINWPFMHANDYLGCYKPLILSDNYQAHMIWFPLNWKGDSISFYNSTSMDGNSFEDRPPRADFLNYNSKSLMGDIEYVLIIGLTVQFIDHPYTIEVLEQLKSYDLICTSRSGRSKLYHIKKKVSN